MSTCELLNGRSPSSFSVAVVLGGGAIMGNSVALRGDDDRLREGESERALKKKKED